MMEDQTQTADQTTDTFDHPPDDTNVIDATAIIAENAAKKGESSHRGRQTHAAVLAEIMEAADFFRTADDKAFADIQINGHRETWAVRSRGFRIWLLSRFFEQTGGTPSTEGLQGALGVAEAKALFEGETREVFHRVGEHKGNYYLDLADDQWRAVQISKTGWQIIDTPPIRFVRSPKTLALKPPVKKGSILDLKGLINLKSDDDFALVVAWLLAALNPSGPYPILAISGQKGTAKSSFARALIGLVDPCQAPLLSLPKSDRDLFISASRRHISAFDNLSSVPDWLSDSLCRLATGAGFATRALHTNDEELVIDTCNPVVMTSIETVVTRTDLADRALAIALDTIEGKDRTTEKDLQSEFEKLAPGILGALLDGVSEGLRNRGTVKLDSLPRMADFAQWAAECETAFFKEGTIARLFRDNQKAATRNLLEDNALSAALIEFMADRDIWIGTATQLLTQLEAFANYTRGRSPDWPKAANALSRKLAHLVGPLEQAQLKVALPSSHRTEKRDISIKKMT